MLGIQCKVPSMVSVPASQQVNNPPAPKVHNALVMKGIVLGCRDQTTISSSDVFHVLCSESGSSYEMGNIIKRSIYGVVLHGFVLQQMGVSAKDAPTVQMKVFLRRNEAVAIKLYDKRLLRANISKGQVGENPLHEITAMQYLSSFSDLNDTHVMGQIECCMDEQNIYSVMPYFHGCELFDVVKSSGALQENKTRLIFRQILMGIQSLHSAGIAHRDLSLENILFDDEQGRAVIIDLGMSIMMPLNTPNNSNSALNIHCGKRSYMAPEVVLGDIYVDPIAGDIWSAGVCLLYLLLGFPPMDQASEGDIRFMLITHDRLPELLLHWGRKLSDSAVDLVQLMLRADPSERPTVDQLLCHPWVSLGVCQFDRRQLLSMLEVFEEALLSPLAPALLPTPVTMMKQTRSTAATTDVSKVDSVNGISKLAAMILVDNYHIPSLLPASC